MPPLGKSLSEESMHIDAVEIGFQIFQRQSEIKNGDVVDVGRLCAAMLGYPFVLLNLALSFQAAYASPIIMMSQNGQPRMSERRNHLDLQVNLLAEQENTEMLRLLRLLCERLEIQISADSALHALSRKPSHTP